MGPSSRYIPTRDSWPAELAMMAGVGMFFALAGVYASDAVSVQLRLIYWEAIMLASGVFIISTEIIWHRYGPTRLQGAWVSLIFVILIANLPQTAMVAFFQITLVELTDRANNPDFVSPTAAQNLANTPILWGMVLVVIAPMVGLLRALRVFLSQRRSSRVEPPVLHETVESTTAPDLLAAHLSAPMRNSTLIALQAEDHYVRVYTAAGNDLVLLRFSDALNSVSERSGFRLHRSWWVAQASIQSAKFKDGRGEVSLTGDITAPLSRTYVASLRKAGWLG